MAGVTISVQVKGTDVTLEFPHYILTMTMHGDPTKSVCLVHLQAPAGPSCDVPLTEEEMVCAATDDIFVVPMPVEGGICYFPVAQHYLSLTINEEFEDTLRLLWAGPDGKLALVHRHAIEEGRVRLTTLRPMLAKVLATMMHVRADVRVFVSVSKTFDQHEMHFADAVPDDHQYMEITHLRTPESVSAVKVGSRLRVPAGGVDAVKEALAAVPLPAGFALEITEKR